MERFTRSCDEAADFPLNLVRHNTYPHKLKNYLGRLDERENELFSSEEDGDIDLMDYDSQSQTCQTVSKESVKELKEYLHYEQPKCAYVFLHAANSRDRLYASRKLVTFVLTYYQVMPSFLDFLFPFGRQEHARDLNFSGFFEESNLGGPRQSNKKRLELGRSGKELRMCYNLKSVERSEFQTHMPWSIRQIALYHSLDVVTGEVVWVIVKGDELIKERIEEFAEEQASAKISSSSRSQNAASLISTLETHMILCDWCGEDWRWYINYLENLLQAKTKRTIGIQLDTPKTTFARSESGFSNWEPKRISSGEKRSTWTSSLVTSFSRTSTKIESPIPGQVPLSSSQSFPLSKIGQKLAISSYAPEWQNTESFSFSDLEQVQHVEDKANEALLILESNISVLEKLQAHYSSNLDQLHKQCGNEIELETFDKRISSTIDNLRMQCARTTTLLRVIADRKNLLYGILQFQSMEASKLLAARAQQSTENMELITLDMHNLAVRTKQETVSMRIITLVTLFFLPGTFISTIMSTDIVKFQTDAGGKSQKVFHLDALQLFLAIALPMMISVFGAWYAVYWWINRKEEGKRQQNMLDQVYV